MHYDLVIRGATLVRPEGRLEADLAIRAGRIEEIASDIPGAGR